MSKNSSARYYQKNKESLPKRYQDLSEEENNKNREYDRERYKNLAEDEKQRLFEYRKKYYKLWKNRTT